MYIHIYVHILYTYIHMLGQLLSVDQQRHNNTNVYFTTVVII